MTFYKNLLQLQQILDRTKYDDLKLEHPVLIPAILDPLVAVFACLEIAQMRTLPPNKIIRRPDVTIVLTAEVDAVDAGLDGILGHIELTFGRSPAAQTVWGHLNYRA